MASHSTDNYLLSRDYVASARLNLQHYLWQQAYGYYLHPDIPITKCTSRIADVGTGSGIWLMDVARQLPQSMQLDGIDIDLSQCPPQEWLPSNVKLRQWDVFAEVPQDMVESYDIVCLRHFIMVVKDNDPAPLLQSVLKLLKPGGYLQWGEWNSAERRLVKKGSNASTVGLERAWADHLSFRATVVQPTWPGELDTCFRKARMGKVSMDARYSDLSHLPYQNDNILMMFEELLGRAASRTSAERQEEAKRNLAQAARETRSGAAWNLRRVIVVGQKATAASEVV